MGEFPLSDDVLFVGHSLVGVEIPAMLDDVVESQGGRGGVRFQIINGAPLVWNWDNSATAQGVDARAALPEGETEIVVLTEAIPLRNHLTWSETDRYAQAFFDLAIRSNPNTRVYLYETWHSLDSGSGVDVEYDDRDHIPWRARLEQDLPLWERVVAQVNARRAPGAPEMRLVPVGQALGRLDDAIRRGEVAGLADIRSLFRDDIHLNDLGAYFATMVQYATLYGRDPRGLPRSLRDEWGVGFDAPPPALALRLQEIAWDAVRAHPQSGVRAAGTARLGVGLAEIADWSTQQPFVDLMKSARPWVGHLPGQWGGWGHEELSAGGHLDPQGWPLRIPAPLTAIATLILSDQPAEAASLAGRYRVSYRGQGELRLDGRAAVVSRRAGEIVFDYTPGPGSVVLTIAGTDPRGTGDHIRDIVVVKEANLDLHAAGATFNPDWLARIDGVAEVRFMDWMMTNGSTISSWAERPLTSDYTYALRGAPAEIMVELANKLDVDAWFNMPHRADDDYFRRFAALVRDGLEHERKVYVEYSNEIWNWMFEQAHWARDRAGELWGGDAPGDAWMQFAGLRAAEMAQVWDEAFAGEAEHRLVKVIATQTGWRGLEEALLTAPLRDADQDTPAAQFDAYAVAGYFGASLGHDGKAPRLLDWIAESRTAAERAADAEGLAGAARAAWVAAHRFDDVSARVATELLDGSATGDDDGSIAEFVCELAPYHAEVARRHGLDLVMYEGGAHLVGVGPWGENDDMAAFMTHFSYTPEMAALYRRLLDGWAASAPSRFNAYVDVSPPSRWGSWGALRHLDDANPRWEALREPPTAMRESCAAEARPTDAAYPAAPSIGLPG